MNFAIVGCGNMGYKRAKSLQSDDRLIFCVDVDINKARKLANQYNAGGASNYEYIFTSEIDAVIVSTNNSNLFPVAMCAIENKKHVLIEKPAGMNSDEILNLISASIQNNVMVSVGFNHRVHPAIWQAKNNVVDGAIGDLMFIRGRYGHGGRLGMENEWRANPLLSGGGEGKDQATHLIDLSRWFFSMKNDETFTNIYGEIDTYFWDMPVEDNIFLTLRTLDNKTAFLHASCTEWRNLFSLEIYGKKGKLHIEGLGGSYDIEKLTYYKMLPAMGKPEVQSWEYLEEDNSWANELKNFKLKIKENILPSPNLFDAYHAMSVIEKVYRIDKSRRKNERILI